MSVDQIRGILIHKTKYKNSPKWIKRVKAMHDDQVLAVYFRMKGAGQILK